MSATTKVSKAGVFLNSLFFVFSLYAMGVTVYMVFFSGSVELGKHGIFWFLASILSLTIPIIAPRIQDISFKIFAGETTISLSQQIQEAVKEQIRDSMMLNKVFELLESVDKKPLSDGEKEAIKDSIKKATPIVRDAIFSVASSIRTRIVYAMINPDFSRDLEKHQKELDKFIVVFEALIDAANIEQSQGKVAQDLHAYKAQLAYVYKDRYNPKGKTGDYRLAYDLIDEAIHLRNKLKLKNITYTIYEFNRLVLGICLFDENSPTLDEDFEAVWKDSSTRFMLFDTSDIIAPGLEPWVEKHQGKKAEYSNR